MTRIDRLRTRMQEQKLPALLVTTAKNVRYLANFTGSAGCVLLTASEKYFITDFRYTEQARNQAQGFTVRIHQQGIFHEVAQILKDEGIQTLGIEADSMTVADFDNLKAQLPESDLVKTRGWIEKVREIKDPEEIALIKKACEITDGAFQHILTFIKPGVSEIQVANELEAYCKSQGASAMSFDTIVASGYRAAMPHGVASDKIIESGDIITLDFGCYYQGYSSDMTRTIGLGDVDPQLKEIYQIVLDAHLAVTQAAKPGISGADLDAVARDYISEKGYGDAFGHSTGHGLGLDVHEGPRVAYTNPEPLEVNNVITNEPGIYIEGLGGVRIEDDLLLTEGGCQVLNSSPKEWIQL